MASRYVEKSKPMTDLFDYHKLARTEDPHTSKTAAKMLTAETVGKHHHTILDALADYGPMAPEQIEDLTGLAMWRRMNELERSNLIEDTGRLHTNRTGRKARIFRLPEKMPWDYS